MAKSMTNVLLKENTPIFTSIVLAGPRDLKKRLKNKVPEPLLSQIKKVVPVTHGGVQGLEETLGILNPKFCIRNITEADNVTGMEE